MMRLLQYAFLACALLCSSCKKDKDSVPTIEPAVGIEIADFAGEWRLSAWSGGTDLDKEIYLRLNADQTFTLYQNIVSHGFERFDGTFTFDSQSALIRGTYASGTPWGGGIHHRSADRKQHAMADGRDRRHRHLHPQRHPRPPAPARLAQRQRPVPVTDAFTTKQQNLGSAVFRSGIANATNRRHVIPNIYPLLSILSMEGFVAVTSCSICCCVGASPAATGVMRFPFSGMFCVTVGMRMAHPGRVSAGVILLFWPGMGLLQSVFSIIVIFLRPLQNTYRPEKKQAGNAETLSA